MRYQHDHHDHWVPSERYWDTLPRIFLTHQALYEHDRRQRQQDTKPQTLEQAHSPRQAQTSRQAQTPRQEQTPRQYYDLQRFARCGGPDLSAIRGFRYPTMLKRTGLLSRLMTNSDETPTSQRTGPYDANYELKLAQAGIFIEKQRDENGNRVRPDNYDQIITRLNQRRLSLSSTQFTEQDFEKFQDKVQRFRREAEVMRKIIPVIEGSGEEIDSDSGLFNNLEPFDPEIGMAVPDSYDGARPQSIDHRVLKKLNSHIVPSTDMSRPAAPNFFLEAKSTGARNDVAIKQATYVGAIGARAMLSLQSFPSDTLQYDNNAYSFTSTYQNGHLMIYASHATAPKISGQPPQYHITLLGGFTIIGDIATFQNGVTFYRNVRELAKEQRDALIQQANQMAEQQPTYERRTKTRSHSPTSAQALAEIVLDAAKKSYKFLLAKPLSTRTSSPTDGRGSSPETDTSTDELVSKKASKRSRLVKDPN